ncbi:MAG TPA: hypothetical protein VHA77_04265 [Xanthobacteraceae bacterium]|nr:hypothetical protein [Xanthobacteraceae bacterium]
MTTLARKHGSPRRVRGVPLVPGVLASAGGILLALGFIGYVLWPRWPEPPVAADGPALPIVVGGVVFNVPPAAVRVAVQRHPGAQERVDLVFLWPSLAPPAPKATTPATPAGEDRLFVTIAEADGTLAPPERLRTIYPRYAAASPTPEPNGLTGFAFGDDTPYRGEDLLFDRPDGEHFLVRCSRQAGPTPGMCLYEQRIGGADLTARFPREWLHDWRKVAAGIERLAAQLHPDRN